MRWVSFGATSSIWVSASHECSICKHTFWSWAGLVSVEPDANVDQIACDVYGFAQNPATHLLVLQVASEVHDPPASSMPSGSASGWDAGGSHAGHEPTPAHLESMQSAKPSPSLSRPSSQTSA